MRPASAGLLAASKRRVAYSLLQTNHNKGASVTGFTLSATAAGSLIILATSYDATTTLTGISGGGTWAQLGAQLDGGNGQNMATWYLQNASAGTTSFTFTITGGSDLGACGWAAAEFSGVTQGGSALRTSDATKSFGVTTAVTDAETSFNITPTTGDLLIATTCDQNGTVPTITAGTGWALAITEPGTNATGAAAIEYKTAATSSAQNATYTFNKVGDSYTVQIGAFKPQ